MRAARVRLGGRRSRLPGILVKPSRWHTSCRCGAEPQAFMAKTSEVAASAAVPSSADIDRAAEFAREALPSAAHFCGPADFAGEPLLLEGEGPEALAPGTARRRALDAALQELDDGAEEPSIQWRRDFSLLLGLERVLAEDPPKLRDGAQLNPHPGDALSGTLTELMAEQQGAAENGAGPVVEEVEAGEPVADGEDEEEPADLAPDEEPQGGEGEASEEEEQEPGG